MFSRLPPSVSVPLKPVAENAKSSIARTPDGTIRLPRMFHIFSNVWGKISVRPLPSVSVPSKSVSKNALSKISVTLSGITRLPLNGTNLNASLPILSRFCERVSVPLKPVS